MKLTMSKGSLMRKLRLIHSWLGFFVFPWIIIIGATGFYLNHWQPILNFVQKADYDESLFDLWPASAEVTVDTASRVAAQYWPEEAARIEPDYNYHGRAASRFRKASGSVIVTKPTGHYFVKTNLSRKTYAPDGTLLHSKIYWGSIFKRLHTDGWLGSGLGTWLADLTSLAMVVFGLSGFTLWLVPRSRKLLRVLRSG